MTLRLKGANDESVMTIFEEVIQGKRFGSVRAYSHPVELKGRKIELETSGEAIKLWINGDIVRELREVKSPVCSFSEVDVTVKVAMPEGKDRSWRIFLLGTKLARDRYRLAELPKGVDTAIIQAVFPVKKDPVKKDPGKEKVDGRGKEKVPG